MEKEMRCHFLMVITKTLNSTWGLLLFFIINIANSEVDITDKENQIWVLILSIGILFLVFLIVLFHFLRWRKTYIYIENGNLIVDRRLAFMKKKTAIQLSGIATVNMEQSLFERIFGVWHLKLDINSKVTADSTDFDLIFRWEEAQKLQNILTEDKNEEIKTDGDNEENERQRESVIRFDFLTIIRHGIVDSIVGTLLAFIIFVSAINGLFVGFSIAGGILGALVVVVLIVQMLFSYLKNIFKYYGFQVEKEHERLLIRYGFFTKKEFSVPLKKVSAVFIKQSFAARMFSLYKGELICVGMNDNENEEMPAFCLYVKKEELEAVIEKIAPEYNLQGEEYKCEKKMIKALVVQMLFMNIILDFFVLAVDVGIGIGAGALVNIKIILLGIVIVFTASLFIMLLRYIGILNRRVILDKNMLGVRLGILKRQTLVTSYGKVQSISGTYGPVLKRLCMTKGRITILASTIHRIQSLGYIEEFTYTLLKKKIANNSVVPRRILLSKT